MAEKKNEEVKKEAKKEPFDEELEFDEDGAEDEKAPALKKKAVPAKEPPPEEGPKLVKKDAKEAPIQNKVLPRRAFILDRTGKKQKFTEAAREAAEKTGVQVEEDTEFLEYAHGAYHRAFDGRKTENVGYVNANGVLFPPGFKFRGGHVASAAPEHGVVLVHCPKCRHRQSIDEAVQGECGNMKTKGPEGEDIGPCGYSAYEELDSFELAE